MMAGGQFSFYYDSNTFYYEFDNSYGNSDQEKGSAVINEGDASVTVTAESWYTSNNWTETPSGSSKKHQTHSSCGFILQFYDDDTADSYEWLVKYEPEEDGSESNDSEEDENYEDYIPHTFPTKSIGTDRYDESKGDYTADVVYDFLTADDDYERYYGN